MAKLYVKFVKAILFNKPVLRHVWDWDGCGFEASSYCPMKLQNVKYKWKSELTL